MPPKQQSYFQGFIGKQFDHTEKKRISILTSQISLSADL